MFAYASNAEWARYLDVPQPYTWRNAEEHIAQTILADPAKNPTWAIVHEGRVSGGINLTFDAFGAAEMGYSITRPLWGRGLMTEAAVAVLAYGFQSMDPARIYAHADIRNTGSWRVMEKLGMQREGVLRRHRTLRGENIDDVLYAILREEWSPPESP